MQRWREKALADPAAGVAEVAARLSEGIRLRIANPVNTPLRDVRIDIEFDRPIVALDWEELDEDDKISLFPDRPAEWGRGTFLSLVTPMAAHAMLPSNSNGALRIVQSSPARLSLSLDLLRSKETFLSDEGEVVLVAHVDAETREPITAQWRLTAGDVHDVLTGEVSIPVDYRDWSEGVKYLAGDS